MSDIQQLVKDFTEKLGLETDISIRYIDLVSEVGELGKEILKGNRYGKEGFSLTEDFESEAGDVLFAFLCVCNSAGIDAERALIGAIQKYSERFADKETIDSGS